MAEFRVAFDELARHVRLDGLHVGRQKQARAVRPLLVYVVDYLRVPDVVNLINGQLRLDLREGVPVAVVVVADVLVIKLRRRRALVGRAQGLVVPVLHDVHAVRVQRGHEQDDRVAQDFLNLRLV